MCKRKGRIIGILILIINKYNINVTMLRKKTVYIRAREISASFLEISRDFKNTHKNFFYIYKCDFTRNIRNIVTKSVKCAFARLEAFGNFWEIVTFCNFRNIRGSFGASFAKIKRNTQFIHFCLLKNVETVLKVSTVIFCTFLKKSGENLLHQKINCNRQKLPTALKNSKNCCL